MDDRTYHFLAELLDAFLWGGELVGNENLPDHGPAVFVSNHVGSLGPIAAMASLPLRVYPWVIGDMLDADKAPAYLNMDFVEKQFHLRPPLSLWISKALSKITVPLLRSAGCVGVWQGEALLDTYRVSANLLAEGKCLLVFPEDPKQALNEEYQMSPFQKGFVHLGEFFYKQTHQCLRFYPLVVHVDSSRVKVGRPIAFNPINPAHRERARIRTVLEAMIHEMYISMTMEGYQGIPLPH
ncbi:MAG TPA: hypothetical protein VMT73_13615 [Anaerolineales bacterium]|nr:hypothetical protein [Anaerolineales bacterium]